MEDKEKTSLATTDDIKPVEEPTVKVVKRKKKFGGIIADDIKDVGSYVWNDVLKPAIKDTFYDVVSNGFNRLIYGNDRGRRTNNRYGDRVSYNRFYEKTYLDRPSYIRSDSRDYYDDPEMDSNSRYVNAYDIVTTTYGEAEAIIHKAEMALASSRNGYITVAEYYQIASDRTNPIRPNPIDVKWGWTDIHSATPKRSNRDGGYVIVMPKPMPID